MAFAGDSRERRATGYSKEEARQEAARCFPCQCLECVKVCTYLEEYGSYPKSYVRQIYNNECIVMGVRKANRMVNSCALCGLCTAVCPEDFSMADVCLDARRSMVRSGKMPPSAHDFALRDMAFSQSEAFALARHQPGFHSSRTAFLPGCQLSASSPDHVASCYEYLRNTTRRRRGPDPPVLRRARALGRQRRKISAGAPLSRRRMAGTGQAAADYRLLFLLPHAARSSSADSH